MLHYLVHNMLTNTYVLLSLPKEVNPNLIGLSSEWTIHNNPSEYWEAAEIRLKQMNSFQKAWKEQNS